MLPPFSPDSKDPLSIVPDVRFVCSFFAMDVRREWEVGKTAAASNREATHDGKNSNTDGEERDAKRKRTDHPRDSRPGLEINSGDGDVASDVQRKKRKECDSVTEGLDSIEKEWGIQSSTRGNEGISSSGGTAEGEDAGQSSCDPSEYSAELWRKYDEHCAFVEANPECYILKLTLEEFVGQTDADESEFGPEDTLETIWEEIIHAPIPFEERIRIWKQRHNRFVEVEWKKKKREDEGERSRHC